MQGSFKIQLINMGTRAAAFTAKIRVLYDWQLRLMHNIQPLPSGIDIANTVKYFSQTLLSVLKDVPNSPYEMLIDPSKDHIRMALYPNLDYKGLFNAISQLVDSAPHIQYGVQAFGQAILQCLGCILPYLDYDMIDNLPYLVAYCVAVFPVSLHQEIINLLCYYVLPFTITRRFEDEECQASQSVAAIIMMVFQHSSNPAHHCQLLECLMSMKRNVVRDVLCVIAYGTSVARLAAARLLFYCWPPFHATLHDRRGLLCKLYTEREALPCQREGCGGVGGTPAEAAKVCYSHSASVSYAPERPPPLYLCIECANDIHREQPAHTFKDMLHAMHPPSLVCESKNCRSTDRAAYSICFSNECATFNGNRPIRYCASCHLSRHNLRRGQTHVHHARLQPAQGGDTDLVEAIVSLLKESKPLNMEDLDCVSEASRNGIKVTLPDPISIEDRQLLGRYGVWLMVGLCSPTADTPTETLARLLSVLFHWFHVTSYAYTGLLSEGVERVKWECVVSWVCSVAPAVTRSCVRAPSHQHTHSQPLSPMPIVVQLASLYCLMPYGIISQEIWDDIMPEWMETICTEVPDKELYQLKTVVGKIFEPECPLVGIDEKQMYRFAAVRFINNPTPETVMPPLLWFQTLTALEVKLPLTQLFQWFSTSVVGMPEKIVKSPSEKLPEANGSPPNNVNGKTEAKEKEDKSQESKKTDNMKPENLTCCILMLDILLKQMELQRRRVNVESVSSDATKLLRLMLTTNQSNTIEHAKCISEGSCSYCEAAALWHQLSVQLVRTVVPPAFKPEPLSKDPWSDLQVKKPSQYSERLSRPAPSVDAALSHVASATADRATVGGVLVHMPHLMTATVETITEQLDMAVSLPPTEQPTMASAKSITLSDVDVASATAMVSSPNLIGNGASVANGTGEPDVWSTSCGNFHFCIADLPQPLQYVHQLLLTLKSTSRPDVLYHLLQCLQIMIIDAGVLTEHKGFLIWLQENLLIENLWSVVEGNRAHVGSAAVKAALAGAAYGNGGEVLRAVIQKQFSSTDPNVRGAALRRTAMLIRFMDSDRVRASPPLQAALGAALAALVRSMDDPDVSVAQRATLLLPTIHDEAIELLLFCLENQFDQVMEDRTTILQCLYQLHNTLSDRKILNWQFFLNRFETLLLEAHALNNKNVDLNMLREVTGCAKSEVVVARVRRAQQCLARRAGAGAGVVGGGAGAHRARSWARTESAPPAPPPLPQPHDREKIYNRQFSAPLLKRKTSRFGLGQLLTSQGTPKISTFLDGVSDPMAGCNKNVDVEENDRETANLLVFLLMQFLSRSDQAHPTEDKQESQTQEMVLKHLFTLVGYNVTEKSFIVTPYVMRQSSVFNAFIANLPQVLDQNHVMGASIAEHVLQILQYCVGGGHTTTTSVLSLVPHVGRHWLMSFLIILYKYDYTTPPLSTHVQALIRIVLNTIDSQYHQCKRYQPRFHMSEYSQPLSKSQNTEQEPTPVSVPAVHKPPSVRAHWDSRDANKFHQWSLDQDSSESELIAIPETSDKSDTTMHGSTAPGSFDDPSQYEEQPKLDSSVASGTTPTSQPAPPTITEHGSKPHQLSTSSSVSINESDSSNVKSTAISSHSVEIWPDQLLQQGRSSVPTTKVFGNRKRIVVGISPDVSNAENQPSGVKSPPQNKQLKTPCLVAAAYASPETPLSKMEVTWGDTLPSVPVAVSKEPIHIPPAERLLPIGANLGDRVMEGLNIPEDSTFTDKTDTTEPEMSMPQTETDKLTDTTRQCGSSSRRLARQPALASPSDPDLMTPTQPNTHEVTEWWSASREDYGSCDVTMRPTMKYRCGECGSSLEQCSGECLGLCCLVLATFVHRDRAQAAHILPLALTHLAKVCGVAGEGRDGSGGASGSGSGVATQVLRTILHNTARNNVFTQIFSHNIPANEKQRQLFYKSIAQAFVDFNEMYPSSPIQLVVEHLNSKKTLPLEQLPTILNNMALYMECLPPEALGPPAAYTMVAGACDSLLRGAGAALWARAAPPRAAPPALRAAAALLRAAPATAAATAATPAQHPPKSILEPISKILSFAIQNVALRLSLITDLSAACVKAFTRERDKLIVCRVLAYELLQAVRVKTTIPDENFFVLLQFVLQGYGVPLFLPPQMKPRDILVCGSELDPVARKALCAGAVDCMRPHLSDIMDLLMDPNLLNKIKGSVCRHGGRGLWLWEERLGGGVKAALAQLAAAELSAETARSRPPAAPPAWQPPNNNRELSETVSRVRLVSWLLLGALAAGGTSSTGTGATGTGGPGTGLPSPPPIPIHALCHIADHVQTIMSSYIEQGKSSSQRMSPLFHAFILCQLWTIYLEEVSRMGAPNEAGGGAAMGALLHFWCLVLPSALQLLNRNKLLAETVNLHFLSLIESLQECNSTVLYKLLPLWTPLLHSPLFNMPRHVSCRLAAVRTAPPPQPHAPIVDSTSDSNAPSATPPQARRLHRLLSKMAQLELQPDTFYII